MIPLSKQIKEIYSRLEALESKNYWTESKYFNTGNFYIEPEGVAYTYLIKISSSGGTQKPSLILAANNGNISNLYVTNLGGEMFKNAGIEDGKIKVTTQNNYGDYSYIKLM